MLSREGHKPKARKVEVKYCHFQIFRRDWGWVHHSSACKKEKESERLATQLKALGETLRLRIQVEVFSSSFPSNRDIFLQRKSLLKKFPSCLRLSLWMNWTRSNKCSKVYYSLTEAYNGRRIPLSVLPSVNCRNTLKE